MGGKENCPNAYVVHMATPWFCLSLIPCVYVRGGEMCTDSYFPHV